MKPNNFNIVAQAAADPAGTDHDPDLDLRLNIASARFFALLEADYEAREAWRAFKDAASGLDITEIVLTAARRLCRSLPNASLEDAARAVANDLARFCQPFPSGGDQ